MGLKNHLTFCGYHTVKPNSAHSPSAATRPYTDAAVLLAYIFDANAANPCVGVAQCGLRRGRREDHYHYQC
ncbi:unnamed protein product [Haemonchus placei]|uniref:SCP domain-containing protein n=1 Tax=Haemonchus placei TaxID=6290 RepID=A0A0N4WAZ4_HAEPC|nr:unnamed protein product [Haemonchus placei]